MRMAEIMISALESINDISCGADFPPSFKCGGRNELCTCSETLSFQPLASSQLLGRGAAKFGPAGLPKA